MRETVARVAAHGSPRVLRSCSGCSSWCSPGRIRSSIAAPAPGASNAHLRAHDRLPGMSTDSDAETLAAMADAAGGVDMLVHHRWRELLGRDALTRRFYRELEGVVGSLARHRARARAATRRGASSPCSALRASSFSRSSRPRGGSTATASSCATRSTRAAPGGGEVHRRLLDPLFFGTLNTPVAPARRGGPRVRPDPVPERRTVRADRARAAHGRPALHRRSARRAHRRAARALSRHGPREFVGVERGRDRSGDARPRVRVAHGRRRSAHVGRVLHAQRDHRTRGRRGTRGRAHVARCSGRRSKAPRATARRSRPARHRHAVAAPCRGSASSTPPAGPARSSCTCSSASRISRTRPGTSARRDRRRDVLTRSIFGVDVNPTAVWLCELRLWLSVVIDADRERPARRARRCRISTGTFAWATRSPAPRSTSPPDRRAGRARAAARPVRALDRRAQADRSRGALDREERRAAFAGGGARARPIAARRRDLICAHALARPVRRAQHDPGAGTASDAARRPAIARSRSSGGGLPRCGRARRFRSHFPCISPTPPRAGGFDLIVGNPPWVRLHNIPPADARLTSRALSLVP